MTTRRSFVHGLPAVLASGMVLGAAPETSGEQEAWLDELLQHPHRLLVDSGVLPDAPSLRRTVNYLDAMNQAYATPDAQLGVAIGLHGSAVAIALSDSIWARFGLGMRLGVKLPGGDVPRTNPWLFAPRTGVEAVRARGVRLLVCANAIRRLAGQLAGVSEDTEMLFQQLAADAGERATVVPAMIAAAARAQSRGVPCVVV